MPGRQSHGVAPLKKPKVRNTSKKRVLDAFSIASYQNPDKIKIRQNRLGAHEGGNKPNKRPRDEDDENEEEVERSTKKKAKGPQKGRFDELDLDEGSDSEGNEWKMGQVDSDDDSDLDSDEAFGESDEELFEGFAFSGSSDKKLKKKKGPRSKHMNLDEDENEDEDSELEEGDLGEDAVDLAAMLDMDSDDNGVEKPIRRVTHQSDGGSDSGGVEEGSEESESESSVSSADEDDETTDPAKLAALQNMIANLPQEDDSGQGGTKRRGNGINEYSTVSDFLPTSKATITLDSLGLSMVKDPQIKKTVKALEAEAKGSRKTAIKSLQVPASKRQQDRLDRNAAYDKSKETLDRWTDTVIHNRRADHLTFPLPDNDLISAQSNKKLLPTNLSKPFNELEATIQSIMEESGLATGNGKDDEDHIREFEELETKKLSVEEVKARRDQLRMARELLFREEAKAKRIKKIKSKSYRKVHRKQREKEERQNMEALAEGGYIPSEDELEAQDRRRAEERMGGRHRGSKWAMAMKETGQAMWNDDVRSGFTDMARKDEELRKRIEGKAVRKEFGEKSEDSASDSDDDMTEDDEAAEQTRLLRKLQKVSDSNIMDEPPPGARLANMDFMRKADAARKKQNDDMVEEMRRELAGEEDDSEEVEVGDIGRQKFGPMKSAVPEKKSRPKNTSQFEEPSGSDDENIAEPEARGANNERASSSVKSKDITRSKGTMAELLSQHQIDSTSEGGAWSKVTSKSTLISDSETKRRRHQKNNAKDVEELDLSKAAVIATQPKPRNSTKRTVHLEVDSGSEENGDDNSIHLPFAIKDQELIKRAFAGADVVGEFEAEKKQTIEDEDEKVVDNTLPGWGSWVGDGVSKRDKARNKGRFLTKTEGIKAQNRKDAKLERVIINEKRVKKNGKYLASSLPHPFETKQQYERSLRLPLGPEWATKETFQNSTKPRILLKQGIIAPMSRPML